ncbi:MAG: hypothetical protein EWM72_01590 [Nitrospira sp.]|nr:MAG: hypothetical protein EWM72_01590 [Nitrospira sp.]
MAEVVERPYPEMRYRLLRWQERFVLDLFEYLEVSNQIQRN